MTPDRNARGPVHDPREARQRKLMLFLQVALVIALLASLAAVIAPGRTGRTFGVVTVAVLIAVPLSRVIWLAVRWTIKRDYRFAAAAAVLATIVLGAELFGAL